jgi:ribosome-associated protein
MGPEHFRREVVFKAVRSRGPGGQNVNKVSSAAQLSWEFEHSLLLNSDQKSRVRNKLGNMINSEGILMLRSDEYRDLERNKARCLEKLADHVAGALHVPKKRRATKPTRSSQVRRVEQKSRRGEIKKMRGKVRD